MTIVVLVVASALYGLGLWKMHRKGAAWPARYTLAYYLGGMGSYAFVELGFLGTYAHDLRWAFTTRIALLIFVVPALIAAGRPLELLIQASGDGGAARITRILRWRIVRMFGNAMFATVFVAGVFLLFLTPFAWTMRGTPWMEAALGIVVPLLGLIMVLPIAATTGMRSSTFITIEFLLAFVELLIDSIPGILLRLDDAIADHAPVIHNSAPWWPSPLHDQHLSGDFIWFIAEVIDVPILVILLVRWMRRDKAEAKEYDDLTDDEYEAMAQAHLRGER
ncbi:cytochrome c oxidase assembly protein [Microbacterium mangrovi]|nr:cytochrome c oxidase assembly protein [Microbacterium mangrovi]